MTLLINLWTVKTIDLDIPGNLLALEVIECFGACPPLQLIIVAERGTVHGANPRCAATPCPMLTLIG
jgi:hypothetical protein